MHTDFFFDKQCRDTSANVELISVVEFVLRLHVRVEFVRLFPLNVRTCQVQWNDVI